MNFYKKLAYNIIILYNINKDCGGSLRTTPRRSRFRSASLSFFAIIKHCYNLFIGGF